MTNYQLMNEWINEWINLLIHSFMNLNLFWTGLKYICFPNCFCSRFCLHLDPLALLFRLRRGTFVIWCLLASRNLKLYESFFNLTHSDHAVGKRSIFSTLSVHSFISFDDSSRPFQSTRFRYSSIRNWVVSWSPCPLGTRTRTLCSPFDVADNMSCGGRSWYAFELKPTAVLGRSSTLSNPALFKIGMPFFIASSPVQKRVLKDFRWFIRHHSSVVESAAHKKFSNP